MTTAPTPTLPFIHSNGTGAETLLEGYRNAMEKIQDAQAALGAIEFNARDYYPVAGSWDSASAEMRARRESLAKIYDELLAIAIHCSDHVAMVEARRQNKI
jgi:hypothetical protein